MTISNSGKSISDDSTQDALEHLVVEQLRDLIALEQALQKRFTALRSSKETSLVEADVEAEVLQLSSRADRLQRMMDAMAA
jgi:hypothetical protein